MATKRGAASQRAAIISEYDTWLRSWASEKTRKARVQLAAARTDEWGPHGFTPQNIIEFLARPSELTGRPLSKWTKATYHGHLKDFCKWLVAAGHLAESPMEDVRAVKRPKKKPRPLTQGEVDRVLSVVEGVVRDQILFALLAGLRVSEIARIRGEDVSSEGLYVDGKGDSGEVLPMHPDLVEIAQRYPRSGYWFPGGDDGHIDPQRISATVGRLFHSMGITGSIHKCRHYYCTNLMRRGVHVRRVQQLMRHANLETTAGYAAVDADELQTAVNLLPSLNSDHYGRGAVSRLPSLDSPWPDDAA